MTRDQKRALFKPLLAENKRHRKITTESLTVKVGDIGDDAIAGWIKNGHFNRGKDYNGEDDEQPVWSSDKKASFIVRAIAGTAPISIFLRQNEEEDVQETYDGANRILAISEFLEDKLRIRYNGVPFLFSELPPEVQTAFRNQKATTLTMHNCPEEYACRYAADLNHGTPMSMGEHLSLLRAGQNSRCKHFNHYVEKYEWANRGDIGARAGGVKLIALVIMHIEQNTPDWKEHQSAAVRDFFESHDSVKNSTDSDAVFQALDTIIRKWQTEGFKISKKNLPKYIQILEAASILFTFHKKNIDQPMIDTLYGLTESIQKYSPSKLVDAYFKQPN